MSLLFKKVLEKIKYLTNNKVDKTQGFTGDLNNLKTTGFYFTSGNSTNVPIAGYGYYVSVINNGDYTIQMVTTSSDTIFNIKTYKRQFIGESGWTEWVELGSELTKRATNANFNTITKTGTYVNDSSPTGANRPTNLTGILEVKSWGNFVMQKYTIYDGTYFYLRGANNGSWSEWKTYKSN